MTAYVLGLVVHLDPVQLEFVGQGHRPKFKAAGGNIDKVVGAISSGGYYSFQLHSLNSYD